MTRSFKVVAVYLKEMQSDENNNQLMCVICFIRKINVRLDGGSVQILLT